MDHGHIMVFSLSALPRSKIYTSHCQTMFDNDMAMIDHDIMVTAIAGYVGQVIYVQYISELIQAL